MIGRPECVNVFRDGVVITVKNHAPVDTSDQSVKRLVNVRTEPFAMLSVDIVPANLDGEAKSVTDVSQKL